MKKKTPDNPSAFPVTATEQSYHNQNPLMPETGMTLRDYFAAKAMSGLNLLAWKVSEFDELVKRSYNIADAMLKQREL